MKKKVLFGLLFLSSAFAMPLSSSAIIGVGVGTGKIVVDQALKPGSTSSLSPLAVLNTGTEAADYEITIQYHQDQTQLRPLQDWFIFTPAKFHLEPGKVQSVSVKLALPVKAKPGDYFGYLEAHPVVKAEVGTSIGVAAASKLYFSIAPSNIWQALYIKISSWMADRSPWSYIIMWLLVAAVILSILRRYFTLNIGLGRKP